VSAGQQPGTHQPGPAEYDAAEAAGLGGVAWAEDGSQAAPAAGAADASGPDGADPDAGNFGAGGHPDAGNGGQAGADGAGPVGPDGVEMTVEDLLRDLERVTAERDQYLDASRRLQAEFENYRKAVAKREVEARERANESLVSEILPVLDACDGALASGAVDVEPVRATLIDALVKQGLDRIDDAEAPFDPERHDAVMHEPAESGGGPVVAQVLRAGYSWKGRVVRPAMVKVRG
jgi:molecular chaperone GrpE